MKRHTLFVGNAYRHLHHLLEEEGDFYAFDPCAAELVHNYIQKKGGRLKAIINTHGHPDHIGGNQKLKETTNCQVWAGEKTAQELKSVDKILKEKDLLRFIDGDELVVWNTPGHRMDHISFLWKKDGEDYGIFCGDTLFAAGVGNCYNGGDPEVLYETIQKYFSPLADNIKIFSSHDYLETNLRFSLSREPNNHRAQAFLDDYNKRDPKEVFWITDMKQEREINPFLRLDSDEIKKGLVQRPSSSKDVFLALRELRNNW